MKKIIDFFIISFSFFTVIIKNRRAIMKVLTIYFFLLLTFTCFSQTGWQLIYSFPEDIGAICFIDNNIGFAGSGWNASTKKIMKTTDAGNSWNDLIITNNAITRIYFYNYNLGFAIGENGTFYKTTDSGVNWILIPLGETETFRGIYFYNDQIGWSCLGSDKILRTTDGGNNWDNSFTSGAIANEDIEFINEFTGFTVGVYASMYKSTNGGINWNQVTEPMVASMFDIEFINESTGFVVGGTGIAKTANGGNTWSTVLNSGGSQLNSISTFGNKFAWVVGSDKIYYSSNSGINWMSQNFTPYSYLQQISCVDSVNVWVLGDRKLYKTSSGGVTGVEDQNSKLVEKFSLNQNYPNPFNPVTTVSYQVPEREFVTLKVYDLLGREVATLVNEEKPAGSYEVQFNSHSSEVRNLPASRQGLTSGIYFYQLKVYHTNGGAGDPSAISGQVYSETKKMILLK